MFKLLTNLTVRRSWIVVMCAVVFAGVAGYYGGPVASLMTNGDGDFDDPASESVAAEERLSEAADANPGADIVAPIYLAVKAPDDDPRETGQRLGDYAAALEDLPNVEAVAVGLGRTGRLITAAALLFCIAIGSFATSQIVIIKELGVGAALAVLIDATIVRALLVPSLMKLLGSRNWWSPQPLRWLHERIGLSEHAPTEHAPERA
jgi:uncharacterized membrane protein YdfJ with MMPL/SSD domain